MNKAAFIKLSKKYHRGTCTPEEKESFEKLYQSLTAKEGLAPVWDDIAIAQKEQKIFANIIDRMSSSPAFQAPAPTKWYVKVAAAIALLVGVGVVLYFNMNHTLPPTYITKATAQGQRATITLADGSVVKLNAQSQLRYPENFSEDARDVYLEGEAFFDVEKNAKYPFVVRSGDIQTTVLGTSFNVRAFEAEEIAVTVVTGKVNVTSLSRQVTTILNAGEQVNTRHFAKAAVDVDRHIAWHTRTLIFDMIPFQEVIDRLAQAYHVTINIDDPSANHCLIRGRYEGEKLISVLEGLKLVVNFNYEVVDEGVITISGKGCEN